MGLLETMFGRIGVDDSSGSTKFSSHRYDVTYTVSAESHDIAYAVAIRRAELDAFVELVRLERETPYVDDDAGTLEETLDSVLEADSLDAQTWTERMEAPRRTVEPILECWQTIVYGDEGSSEATSEANTEPVQAAETDGSTTDTFAEIVYLPLETESAFAAFLQGCRKRDEHEFDPFELPDDVSTAAGILSRIKRATNRSENRVVVNRRHLPDLSLGAGAPRDESGDRLQPTG